MDTTNMHAWHTTPDPKCDICQHPAKHPYHIGYHEPNGKPVTSCPACKRFN